MSHTETPSSPLPVLGECHSDLPDDGVVMVVPSGKRLQVSFLSTRYSNMDRADGKEVDTVELAKQAWLDANASSSKLFEEHIDTMTALNVPGIDVEGNLELSRVVNASLYALLGAYREDSPYSSAPEGLAATRYYGDALWDVETWQWPTWVAFWPEMARKALEYRARLMHQAELNARNVNQSMPVIRPVSDGLRFPWQSALAGIEQCPGNDEDHLQGDIALAFKQYWYVTNDVQWLKSVGFPVIEGIARFYVSRASYYDGAFHIGNTTGPDEYHEHVTDSAFGNAIARATLLAACELAAPAGAKCNSTFTYVAEHLHIPHDPKQDFHPEFVGFNVSMKIKQADTILMSYPLRVDMPYSTRLHDLEVYSKVQDPHGVAMSWPFISIVWRDVGDEDQAADAFYKSFKVFARPPFYTWHEGNASDGSAGQGAPNLVTAAGGFLQAVWAGYGGVRFEASGILTIRKPRPLPDSSVLRLRSLHFLGARLDLTVYHHGWTLSIAESSPRLAPALELANDTHTSLLTQHPIHMPPGSMARVRTHQATTAYSQDTMLLV